MTYLWPVHANPKDAAGKVFREVASGGKTDKAQLRRLLDQLDAGDVVMVARLDRLARSTRDLLNTARDDHRQEGPVPLAWRYMGGYDHIARPLDAHGCSAASPSSKRDLIRALWTVVLRVVRGVIGMLDLSRQDLLS